MKSFKQYLEEGFVEDYKNIRAQAAEHEATGKTPPGVFSVSSQSSHSLGKDVQGQFQPSNAKIGLAVDPSNARVVKKRVISSSRVAILNTDEMIKGIQKTKPWLLRWVRTGRDLEQAAQLQRSTLVHELGHNFQYGRQVKAELKKYVDKNRELPDENWRSKNMADRSQPEREGRYVKKNRWRRELKKSNIGVGPESLNPKLPLNRVQAYTGYRNLDAEWHARAIQHADRLYDGDYQRSVQAQMRRNPTANIESILTQQRNNAIRGINDNETWMMNNKTYSPSPKTTRQLHDRMGLVMADIEKDMDLTSPEKIKAFREKTLPSKATPTFNRYLTQPRPDTRIEKVVGVVDDLASAGKKLGKGVVNSIDVAIDPLGYALEKAAKGILDTVKGGVKGGVKELVKDVAKGGVKGVVKGGVVSAVGGIIGDQLAKHVAVPALEELGVYDAVGAVSKKAFDNMPSWAVDASERVLAAGERIVDNPVAFAIDALTSPGSFINPQGTTTITANTKTEIEKRKDFDNHIRKNPQLTNDEVLELTKKEEERMKKESPSDSEMTSKHTAPVVATSDKISNWFDRNVINPIFGESYDTSREQYKEYIRSLLLEKYSRI